MADKLVVSGARGASVTEIARVTGSGGVLPTDADSVALEKITTSALAAGTQADPGEFIVRAAGGEALFVGASGTGNDPALRTDLAGQAGGQLVSFKAAGASAALRSNQDKSRETVSVLDFGAKGDGTTNDTAAFNAAIATGKRVVVPYTAAGYSVAGIEVVEGMHVAGEKCGSFEAMPRLLVRESGKSAFYQSEDDNVFNVTFENMACHPAAGVMDARFYDQATQTKYSGYFTFRSIETYLSLSISYKGLFIFPVWEGCRDGYYGTKVNTSHEAFRGLASTYGQTNRQNIFKFTACEFFNAFGGQGAFVASYGTQWVFDCCDFEALDTAAMRGYNLTQVKFRDCWFEGVNATTLVALSDLGGDGSSATFEGCTVVLTNPTPRFFASIESGSLAFKDNIFAYVPAGMKLANNGARVVVNDNNQPTGTGAAGFMDGMHADTYIGGRRLLNGAVDNGLNAMTMQYAGGITATGGFMSQSNISLNTALKTIAVSATGLGGTCIISGADSMGGAQFRFIKDWQGTTIRDVVPPLNATGKVITFQVTEGALQMAVDTGTAIAFTTLLN